MSARLLTDLWNCHDSDVQKIETFQKKLVGCDTRGTALQLKLYSHKIEGRDQNTSNPQSLPPESNALPLGHGTLQHKLTETGYFVPDINYHPYLVITIFVILYISVQ